jgi:major type 1 subunit fimbrin (pilin)
MNLKAITSALLIAGLAAPAAFASTGTITFTGSISNVTCTVSGGEPGTGNPDFTVPIEGVNAGDFPNVGSHAGTTGFRIYVGQAGETTCTNGTQVWAAFEPGSTVDPLTGALITTGAAQGVQIRLFNKSGDPIDVWSPNQSVIKETVADNQAVIAHSAAFERTGNITAGDANSSVVYSIRYEAP